jgi:hypothetical protein
VFRHWLAKNFSSATFLKDICTPKMAVTWWKGSIQEFVEGEIPLSINSLDRIGEGTLFRRSSLKTAPDSMLTAGPKKRHERGWSCGGSVVTLDAGIGGMGKAHGKVGPESRADSYAMVCSLWSLHTLTL